MSAFVERFPETLANCGSGLTCFDPFFVAECNTRAVVNVVGCFPFFFLLFYLSLLSPHLVRTGLAPVEESLSHVIRAVL